MEFGDQPPCLVEAELVQQKDHYQHPKETEQTEVVGILQARLWNRWCCLHSQEEQIQMEKAEDSKQLLHV